MVLVLPGHTFHLHGGEVHRDDPLTFICTQHDRPLGPVNLNARIPSDDTHDEIFSASELHKSPFNKRRIY
jgi:hypothetical protein